MLQNASIFFLYILGWSLTFHDKVPLYLNVSKYSAVINYSSNEIKTWSYSKIFWSEAFSLFLFINFGIIFIINTEKNRNLEIRSITRFFLEKTIFCLSLSFLSIMLKIRLRFSLYFSNIYLFTFFNCLYS